MEPPNGIAFIRSGEIGKDGVVRPTHEIQISEQTHNDLMKRSQLKRKDVLIAIVGATIGAVGIYDLDEPANINQAIAAVRLKDRVLPQFLVAFLSTPTGQQILDYLKRPVARANINLEEVGEILVPVPSLEVQRKFVDEMEAAHNERQRKLEEAGDLFKSFDIWLLTQLGLKPPPINNRRAFAVRPGHLQGRIDPYFYQPRFEKIMQGLAASSFPLRNIGKLCEPPVGGATPTRGDAELYADAGIKFLRILNVKPNEIDLTDVKYIRSTVHHGELLRSQLSADDVLMTITGRVGTAAVVTQDILPANINQHIVRLRIADDECLPQYLAAYLNSPVGLAVSNRGVTGGTRIALDYQAIRSIPIPLPPISIQEKIVEELDKRRAASRRLRQEAEMDWEAAKRRFEEQLLAREAACNNQANA